MRYSEVVSNAIPVARGSVAAGIAAIVVAVSGTTASAQWVEQNVDLQPGWNSVFIEVDPASADAEDVFGGQPVEAVWSPAEDLLIDQRPSSCLEDPNSPDCEPMLLSDWQVWLPPSDPASVVNSLRVIRGNRAYLIKATASATLAIVGTPSSSRTKWREGFNLVGFHVVDDPESTPSFAAYLAPSSAHTPGEVYTVLPDGTPAAVADPATTPITPRRAFWVKADRSIEYDGPLQIDNASLRGVGFGKSLVEHWVTVENLGDSTRTLSITCAPSEAVPSNPVDLPTLAGDVPLRWWKPGGCSGGEERPSWCPLATETWALSAAGDTGVREVVRLAVWRTGLAGAELDADGHGSQYQGLLVIEDGAGFRRLVPVTAQVPPNVGESGTAGGTGATPRPGLYAGHVLVDKVSWVTAPLSDGGSPDVTRPTPATFRFPIIVHLDGSSNYTLLTEVTLMWRPGDGEADPGRTVLVTPQIAPEVLAELEAGDMRDGEPFSRRMSSAAFSFEEDLPMTGGFDTVLHGQTVVGAAASSNRLNPFKHSYHPDHDALTAEGEPAPGELYEVTRTFTLTFEPDPPEGVTRPGWGDSYLGGMYEEAVAGLHRDTIQAAGHFELHRVSLVSTLNDENGGGGR